MSAPHPSAALKDGAPARWFATGMFIATVLCLCVAGCASSAALQFADLNFKRLDPGDPLIVDVTADSCWWSIEGDQIHIALGMGDTASDSGSRMLLSLVLEGIPAGEAREYRLGKQSFRCRRHKGRDHSRYASLTGVASIELLSGNMLSGRFRLIARKQVFHVLTNWTTVGRSLVMGSFLARRDSDRVSSILVQTEEDGMKRRSGGNSITGGVPQPREVVGPAVR